MPAPRPQQGRPRGWVGSTVRDALLRELYRGVIVWNQTRKRDCWGQQHQHARPEAEWMRVSAPELRIISDELWNASQARFAERQRKHTTSGRRRLDIDSPYLLSGYARCAVCGRGFAALAREHGNKRVQFYGCTSFWKRGAKVCTNNMVARMDALDTEVLATLEDDIMRPTIVEEAIRLALEKLAPARQTAGHRRLEAELVRVREECGRLADAIASGGPLDVLVERLTARGARRVAIERELGAERQVVRYASPHALEARLRAKLADWRGLLRRNVTEGRSALRQLLIGPCGSHQ